MVAKPGAPAAAQASAPRAYDVFNGDADGLCALHQFRLAYPRNTQLITGVKRDIDLLKRVPCEGEMDVTVFDVSLDVNVEWLRRILAAGGRISYFDHHSARQAFPHPNLRLFLDDAPDVCTSILVDRVLEGRYRRWAVTAAFGDNLPGPARALAQGIGLSEEDIHALAELGRALNYNAYGENVDDLHFAPQDLYREVSQFADPFDFINTSWHYCRLSEGYREDAERMSSLTPYRQWPGGAIYLLPSTRWARRISGVFANKLVGQPGAASFAVLTENTDGSFVVSVRSGEPAIRAANGLCEQFPGGGGRKAAAGINRMPAVDLDRFISLFCEYFALVGTSARNGELRAR